MQKYVNLIGNQGIETRPSSCSVFYTSSTSQKLGDMTGELVSDEDISGHCQNIAQASHFGKSGRWKRVN